MAGGPVTRRIPTWLIGVAVAVAVLCGLWLVVRDSGFFRVTKVEITGLGGARADRLRAAALDQTTMNVDEQALRVAAAGQPPIASLRAEGQFPDGMKIAVRLYDPAAAVSNGASPAVAVAGDGTVLRGVSTNGLPVVEGIAGAGRVRSPEALEAISLLASAPRALRSRIERASVDRTRGIVVVVRSGPKIYFGTATDAAAKWAAAARVLADPAAAGASYVDVSVPRRPAVGGLAGGVQSGVDTTDPNQPVVPDAGAAGDSGSGTAGSGGDSAGTGQ